MSREVAFGFWEGFIEPAKVLEMPRLILQTKCSHRPNTASETTALNQKLARKPYKP